MCLQAWGLSNGPPSCGASGSSICRRGHCTAGQDSGSGRPAYEGLWSEGPPRRPEVAKNMPPEEGPAWEVHGRCEAGGACREEVQPPALPGVACPCFLPQWQRYLDAGGVLRAGPRSAGPGPEEHRSNCWRSTAGSLGSGLLPSLPPRREGRIRQRTPGCGRIRPAVSACGNKVNRYMERVTQRTVCRFIFDWGDALIRVVLKRNCLIHGEGTLAGGRRRLTRCPAKVPSLGWWRDQGGGIVGLGSAPSGSGVHLRVPECKVHW